MTKRHKKIRNGAVVVTLLGVIGLSLYGQKVREIRKQLESQIALEQEQIDAKNEQLTQMKAELEKMSSDEYIKQMATEKLRMVDKDTIVFKINQ